MERRNRVPVFVDSNLGTHLALDVSPDTYVGDFKRHLKKEHLNCFPKLGEINVNKLMVKRRSFFYHIPDSMPIKYAFQGLQGRWFIHMEACSHGVSSTSQIKDRASSRSDLYEPLREVSNNNTVIKKTKERKINRTPRQKPVVWVTMRTIHLWGSMKRKRRMKDHFLCSAVGGPQSGNYGDDDVGVMEPLAFRAESEHHEEGKSSAVLENPRDTLLEDASVSGIIQKYFSDYEEVILSSSFASMESEIQGKEQWMTVGNDIKNPSGVSANPPFTPQTPPKVSVFPLPCDLSSKTSREKFKRIEVGKRLMVASGKLGISSSSKKRKCSRQLPVPKSSSLVKSIVFEITDSD